MLGRVVVTAVLTGLLAAGATSGAPAQQSISSGQQAANPSGWTIYVAPYDGEPQPDERLQPAAYARGNIVHRYVDRIR